MRAHLMLPFLIPFFQFFKQVSHLRVAITGKVSTVLYTSSLLSYRNNHACNSLVSGSYIIHLCIIILIYYEEKNMPAISWSRQHMIMSITIIKDKFLRATGAPYMSGFCSSSIFLMFSKSNGGPRGAAYMITWILDYHSGLSRSVIRIEMPKTKGYYIANM